jgi:site-specific recombinase XerD
MSITLPAARIQHKNIRSPPDPLAQHSFHPKDQEQAQKNRGNDFMSNEEYIKRFELYFELRGLPETSKDSYLRLLGLFVKHIDDRGKAVDSFSYDDIQEYILYLKNHKHLSPGTINNYMSAVRLFCMSVLEWEWNSNRVPRMKRVKSIPVLPPHDAIMKLLCAPKNIKHRAVLSLLYGSGLRVSEAVRLRIRDINGADMTVRVQDAKHGTDRYTILAESTRSTLREYFKEQIKPHGYNPDDWLFRGRTPGEHINVRSVKNMFIRFRTRHGLDPRISAHTLRHCFATHCLEQGVGIAHIQEMLGHKDIKTTAAYLHLTSKSLMGVKSPLDTASRE